MPFKSKKGGEAFSYDPFELREIESILDKLDVCAEPYGCYSYEKYFSEIDRGIALLSDNDKAMEQVRKFKDSMQRRNRKEMWSVLKYVGPTTDSIFGLTNGHYYYWPCSTDNPCYEGVIDDEEYTSYLYSTEKELWEIAEDPAGMAFRTLTRRPGELDQETLDDIVKKSKSI